MAILPGGEGGETSQGTAAPAPAWPSGGPRGHLDSGFPPRAWSTKLRFFQLGASSLCTVMPGRVLTAGRGNLEHGSLGSGAYGGQQLRVLDGETRSL